VTAPARQRARPPRAPGSFLCATCGRRYLDFRELVRCCRIPPARLVSIRGMDSPNLGALMRIARHALGLFPVTAQECLTRTGAGA
jgi:hypothetical protein